MSVWSRKSDLGHEIERQERLDAMEREMQIATSKPLPKPDNQMTDTKTAVLPMPIRRHSESDPYEGCYSRTSQRTLRRNRQRRRIPRSDEFEHQLIKGLEEENVIRAHAHVITTSNGLHRSLSWLLTVLPPWKRKMPTPNPMKFSVR